MASKPKALPVQTASFVVKVEVIAAFDSLDDSYIAGFGSDSLKHWPQPTNGTSVRREDNWVADFKWIYGLTLAWNRLGAASPWLVELVEEPRVVGV